jgi:hypothetical protein
VSVEGTFGFSPDGGEFEIRDNTAYWADGDITEHFNQAFTRWMSSTSGVEHYADWSDEKRAAVKAEYAEKRRQYEEARNRMPSVVTMTFEECEVDVIAAALHYLQGGLLSRDPLAQESLIEIANPPTEYDVKALKARFTQGEEMP